MKLLGIDLGTNSIGSAWVDTDQQTITTGVSVFPAGVEESDEKRGAPKNQARRAKRTQRRMIKRHAVLKHRLRELLIKNGLIPKDEIELQTWKDDLNPWLLRRKGLNEELTPYEFGRVLIHLSQRRGAWGLTVEQDKNEIVSNTAGFVKGLFVSVNQPINNKQPIALISKEDKKFSPEDLAAASKGKQPKGAKLIKALGLAKRKAEISNIEVNLGDYVEKDQIICELAMDKSDSDEGRIKKAISETHEKIESLKARTFGEMMAILYEKRTYSVGNNNKRNHEPIRNRVNALGEPVYEFCADRDMALNEFGILWNKQKEFNSELSSLLSKDLKKELHDPSSDKTWRSKGLLFGQRNYYWNIGVLGRCDLEPTDQQCPRPDMYAQEFLVLETVNNIRITPPGETSRKLNVEEREKVTKLLNSQKTAKCSSVRKALGINTGKNKNLYSLSLDADPNRSLNTNWFYREIATGAIGQENWDRFDTKTQDSINRAILKFNFENHHHEEKFLEGSQKWWGLSAQQAENLISAWKKRPKADKRISLSRKAVINLLPYLRKGYSVTEARQLFAENAENGATQDQRERYSLNSKKPNKHIRHYLSKHPDQLPPAPMISNPVVRKSIHEVRKHIMAYMHKFGCKPDRVIIELAREGKVSAKVRNQQLAKNRKKEQERKEIVEKFGLENLSKNQREKAIRRVLLCREQKNLCSYSYPDRTITEEQAAQGDNLEIDHIIPRSRGGADALVNRVLCYKASNQGKANQTPKEWLDEDGFLHLEQRFEHLKKENHDKWTMLHKQVQDINGFVNSQLTDTAYASRQVVSWVNEVLYSDTNDTKKRVFTTKGRYTSILRRDWQLFYDRNEINQNEKSRADHRHHAIDAVVIALTGPDRIQQIAHKWQEIEFAKDKGEWIEKLDPIPAPWNTIEQFREQVIDEVKNKIVSHRPSNRKISGYLHKDTMYGVVDTKKNEYTQRIPTIKLSPNHLRVPDGWDRLKNELEEAVSNAHRREIRKRMLNLPDVPPAKSGVIRDRWFREELRQCLKNLGLNPDKFTANQLKEQIKLGNVKMNDVPVKHVTLLKIFKEPVSYRRKYFDHNSKSFKYYDENKNPKTLRVYDSQNNHHIEIRKVVDKKKKEKWVGEAVPNYVAAQRVKSTNNGKPGPIVDRLDNERGEFVMSLSIGEMVFMRHKVTKELGYFTVFKIDSTGTIHFTPHYDAGKSSDTDKIRKREDISLSASQLKECEIDANTPPQKVKVSPIGDISILTKD